MGNKTDVWNVVIAMKVQGQEWNISLTASEQSVLSMLRNGYGFFEAQLKVMAHSSSGQRPAGLIDDALILLRCLVWNRLEDHNGKFVRLQRV